MKNERVLITGGSGFLGTYLVEYLLKKTADTLVVFDRLALSESKKWRGRIIFFKGDVASKKDVARVFTRHGPFRALYHLASAMPNKADSDEAMWKINVEGTRNLVSEAVAHGTQSFIFTSSNVTYGIPASLPVTEKTSLRPLEMYGRSKMAAEEELAKFKGRINVHMFRCPVITGEGRLGLQSILYEFISENKNVYLLGDGSNRYQFVDALDVCVALELATHKKGFDAYTIGGDGVMPLRRLYEKVIAHGGSTSKIRSLPKAPALVALWILDKLNISPLGPYQYTMMSRSLYADTTKIKKNLGWRPRKTNLDSFIENYEWYRKHKNTFTEIGSSGVSANRSLPKLGAFKLLKMIS
jgi:nucleoside-diphosphate-sugar epimerase